LSQALDLESAFALSRFGATDFAGSRSGLPRRS
jgi:hypothetical protein